MVTTILLQLLLVAAPMQDMAGMDHAAAPCPTGPAPLPADMAGWTRKTVVRAGAIAAKATVLPIGEGAVATLLPTPKVSYAVRPEKPGGSVSNGGMFAFTVASAGRYRVALGSGAWIDILAGRTPAVSLAHAPGVACTGIRKMVDFDLTPGRYLLQIAGNGSATLPLMVARLP